MELFRSLIIAVLFILSASSGVNAGGLSQERQEYILDTLRNYTPANSNVGTFESSTTGESQCDPREVAVSQYCIEKKYIKDGYYIVTVAFRKSAETPKQPEAPFIKDGGLLRKDTSKREAFLKEQSDSILKKYVGDDYHKFHSATLEVVNSRAVIVKIQVLEAEELTDLLTDPRVFLVRHVGDPERPMEEVAD